MRTFAVSSAAVSSALLAVVLAGGSALASGTYHGASSVAGGRDAVCAGVTEMTAIVSGSDIRLVGAAYEGAEQDGTGTIKADGTFTATKPAKKGSVTFTGTVNDHAVVAQWKGPDCYGAVDLSR